MSTYVCHFEFQGMPYLVKSCKGIAFFAAGFWINDKHELTHGFDAKYWIPPHKITYIRVDRDE